MLLLTVYSYLRASTAGQEVSIEAQSDQILAYCRVRGLATPLAFEDPATSSRRPFASRRAGGALVRTVRAGDHVVVAKLDRAWRSVTGCLTTVEHFSDLGVTLHLVDLGGASLDLSTAMGKLFLTMAAAFAEFERSCISERTKAGLAVVKARGQRLGRTPWAETVRGAWTLPAVLRLRRALGSDRATSRALNLRLTPAGRDAHTPSALTPAKGTAWTHCKVGHFRRRSEALQENQRK